MPIASTKQNSLLTIIVSLRSWSCAVTTFTCLDKYRYFSHMGLVATKPVFGVSDKAKLKQFLYLQRLARKLDFRL